MMCGPDHPPYCPTPLSLPYPSVTHRSSCAISSSRRRENSKARLPFHLHRHVRIAVEGGEVIANGHPPGIVEPDALKLALMWEPWR